MCCVRCCRFRDRAMPLLMVPGRKIPVIIQHCVAEAAIHRRRTVAYQRTEPILALPQLESLRGVAARELCAARMHRD